MNKKENPSKQEFKNPGVEYRSAPFWSLNDDLDDKELQHQLLEMKKGGMGGGFMHSRIGLITPYLSKEWMDRIKNTVAYAKKIGLLAYLYDEDRWPSGFAGGIVTKKRLNQMKLLQGKKKNGNWTFKETISPKSEWYNDSYYLNTMNRRAVGAFIKSTYDAYKNVVGKEFNKTVPAIFTDEPNYFNPFGDNKSQQIPWTENLASEFKERYGYDLKKNFVSLFEEKGNYRKVRYNYWRLVTELFVENFGKQIHNWCEKNNIALTGHYLCEDNLGSQIRLIGSAMPFYEYEQIPGIDHLSRNIKDLLTLKQCSSVAHQLGQKRTLSELYGCSGQNFSFAGRKWIGDWHSVLGINLFCPHLWLYSMAGCRKRDYPPTISYQQPYWKYNRVIEDHITRVNYAITRGKFVANVLVIHPVESAWCIFEVYKETFKYSKDVNDINNSFVKLLENLLSLHYDFDLGDESLLEKYAGVEDTIFKVGNMSYSTIILPPVISLRESTVKLLEKFVRNGGAVLGSKPYPQYIEGEKDTSGRLKNLFAEVIPIENLSVVAKRDVSITDSNGKEIPEVYYHHRSLDKSDIYFLANTSQEKEFSAEVKIKGEGYLELWDTLTGEIIPLSDKQSDGYLSANLYFYKVGSYIIARHNGKSKSAAKLPASIVPPKSLKPALELTGNWNIKRNDPNSLTLDFCKYKLDNPADKIGTPGKWSPKEEYVLRIQKILEKQKKKQKFSLLFSFKTDFPKRQKSMFLVLERPETYKIKVNGQDVQYTDKGYWIDISFRKIDITKFVNLKGNNTIELSGNFVLPVKPRTLIYLKNGVEVESVYITGDFKVQGKIIKIPHNPPLIKGEIKGGLGIKKGITEGFAGSKFVLCNEDNKTNPANLVTSGYPFYAGSFTLSREFNSSPLKGEGRERVFLEFGNFNSITANVTLNNRNAGLAHIPPYRVEITGLIRKGPNTLKIEMANSLRNLLGPHHFAEIEPEANGPGTFLDEKNWFYNYHLVPFGLGKIKILAAYQSDCVAIGLPNLLGLKNNKRNQNMTKLDSTTRTSSGFQLKFGIPIGL